MNGPSFHQNVVIQASQGRKVNHITFNFVFFCLLQTVRLCWLSLQNLSKLIRLLALVNNVTSSPAQNTCTGE